MWLNLLSASAYTLVVLLLIAIVAALLLALGTALTFLFAVSVWEATLVVMVVAAGALWLLAGSGLHDHDDDRLGEPSEDERPRRLSLTDLPSRTRRSGNRPRR